MTLRSVAKSTFQLTFHKMSIVNLIYEKFTSCNPSFFNVRGFLDEQFSDVTVTVSHVGSAIKSYKLHRNVLAGFSSVLHQSLAHQQTLEITYMSPDEFELLVVCMYTGDVCFHSVSELCFGLYAANLFKSTTLVDKCTERLLKKLVEDCGNALEILKFDERFELRQNNLVLFEMVEETIQKNYGKVLSSEVIKDLEHETMKHLLQMDSICEIPEIEVFNSLLKWTIAHCDKIEPPPRQLQDVVGDLIYHIRYNFIPDGMLKDVVAESELLPAEMMVLVLRGKFDLPFLTLPRQIQKLMSTCTNLEHSVHELSQWTTSDTLIWDGTKGESEKFTLPALETTKTQWQVQFNGFSNDDFGIKVLCTFLDNQFRAASFRVFAVVEEHPQVWMEGASVLKSNENFGWCCFPKKVNDLEITGSIRVKVRLQWTEVDQLPPALNMWMDDDACIRCRWQLHGWKSVIPTCDWWNLYSETFGINGALWNIIMINGKNYTDRKLNVRVHLQHLPESFDCSALSMNCSLSLWNQQFDEKKVEMKKWSQCEWRVINQVSLETRDPLDLIVSIHIKPNN